MYRCDKGPYPRVLYGDPTQHLVGRLPTFVDETVHGLDRREEGIHREAGRRGGERREEEERI
jgi:hypothetical protein